MARLSRIAPEIPVLNLRAAAEFYERQLGFEVVRELPSGDYAVLQRDGVAIHLFEDRAHRSAPVGLHIFTSDLTELYEDYRARGVRFSQGIERKPWGNRDFRIKDEFGNELKFTEPRAEDD